MQLLLTTGIVVFVALAAVDAVGGHSLPCSYGCIVPL